MKPRRKQIPLVQQLQRSAELDAIRLTRKLTRRQQELLRFIAGYQIAHDGISPSYDEMRRGIGCGSKSNVLWLLNSLGERGVIERLAARARAIRILTPISIPQAPDGAPLFAVPLASENSHADT